LKVVSTEHLEPASSEAYITTGEVARMLGVSPKTVARWAKEGRLPHLVTLGGHRRFPADAIRALVDRLEVAG
jgi:excisionase family DNA binding protein